MDRTSLLSCLPFLSSASISTWPPPQALTGNTTCDGGSTLLLEGHWVSIEPCILSGATTTTADGTATTSGPSCFGGSQATNIFADGTKSDPSMCKFEMAVVVPANSNAAQLLNAENHQKLSSPAVSVTTNGSTPQMSPKTPLRSSNINVALRRPHHVVSAKVFVRIDEKYCFRMDARQLKSVEIIAACAAENEVKCKLPPCLLVYFETCCFRIFSLDESCTTETELSLLELVHQRLRICAAEGRFQEETNFHTGADWMASTSSSSSGPSTGSSNEHGQRCGTAASASAPSIYPDDDDDDDRSAAHYQQKIFKAAAAKIVEQRQTSYQQSRLGLQSLDTILGMPAEMWGADELKQLGEHMSDRMTSTADHLSSSYWISRNERRQVFEFYGETQQQEYERELDEVLAKVFPRVQRGRRMVSSALEQSQQQQLQSSQQTPRKRLRLTPLTAFTPNHHEATTTTTPASATAHMHESSSLPSSRHADWLNQAKEILRNHREAVKAHHRLAFLPSRG